MHLKEAKKSLNALKFSNKELYLLLKDTLNAKLRYEQIILNLLEKERNGSKLSVREIVATTKASKTTYGTQ